MVNEQNIARRHRHGDAWARIGIEPPPARPSRRVRLAVYAVGIFAGGFVLMRMANAEDASSGPRNALLTWTAPTTNTDGSAIVGPLSYRVYRGARGTPKTLVATSSALQLLLEMQPLGDQCYQLTAVAANSESDPSVERCKVMKLEAPKNSRFEQPKPKPKP